MTEVRGHEQLRRIAGSKLCIDFLYYLATIQVFTPLSPPLMTDVQSTESPELQTLQAEIKGSASWFYWIAGLSIINSLILAFDGGISFIVGLGLTQIVDGIAYGIVQEGGPAYVTYAALGISILIAGVIGLFGIAGNKRMLGLYIFGIVLYAIDGLIFLAFQDWLPVAFHAYALFCLFKAIGPIKAYNRISKESAPEEPTLRQA